MNNQTLINEGKPSAKRKRIMATVAQDIVISEDDDDVADGIDISNIGKNETEQRIQKTTCCALDALGETIRCTLLEINEIREQNRERRHRELLQILRRMTDQDDETKDINKLTQFNKKVENNEQNIQGKDDFFHVEAGNKITLINSYNKSNSTDDSRIKLTDANHIEPTNTVHNSSTNCIKLLSKLQTTNKPQVSNVKSAVAVKHDDKKEFEKMRAEMLELQREKMQDRERKKRKFLLMQNV